MEKKILGAFIVILSLLNFTFDKNSYRFSKITLYVWLAFVIYILTSALRSEIIGYPLDISIIQITLINILIIPLMSISLRHIPLQKFILIIYTIGWFVSFMTIGYVFHRIGLINSVIFDLETFGGVKTTANFLEFRLTSHYVLFLIVPFILHETFTGRGNFNSYLLLFALLLVVLLSGRRALQLLTFVSIIYLLVTNGGGQILKHRSFLAWLTAISFGAIFGVTYVGNSFGIENIFSSIYQTVTAAFDSNSSSMSKRFIQTTYLIDMLDSSPLWGHGLAAYSIEYIRDDDFKWSYEMVYLAFTVQNGLIGLCLFGVLFTIAVKFRNNLPEAQSMKFAFFIYLCAGATNPFIYFPWAWVIALRLMNYDKQHAN
jgi:hypothetical protein